MRTIWQSTLVRAMLVFAKRHWAVGITEQMDKKIQVSKISWRWVPLAPMLQLSREARHKISSLSSIKEMST